MSFYLSYCLALLAGFALALVFTPLSRALAISVGFIDRPKTDRAHRDPTPFLGGLAVAVAAGLAFALLAPRVPLVTELWNQGLLPRAAVPVLLLLASGALVLGLLDDRFSVTPRQKLLTQTCLAAMFLAGGLSWTVPASYALSALGLVWTVGLINAFNLLDNLDGILGGVGTVVGVFLGALALYQGRPDLGTLALAGAGASLGFLCFNLPPAKIFMGDAGAFFIGFLYAAVGWELGGSDFLTLGSQAAAIILILAYPIFDVTFVSVTRRLEQRPLHIGGVDHTTHRIHTLMGGHRGLIPVYILNALNGAAGLAAAFSPPPVAWSLVAVMVGLYVALGVLLARVPVRRQD